MAVEGFDFEKPLLELEQKIEELKQFAQRKQIDLTKEIRQLEEKADEQKRTIYSRLTAWQKTQVARHMKRPRTLDYISRLFEEFTQLHGDRLFRDDPAIVGGTARFGGLNSISDASGAASSASGRAVMVIGQQKGKDTKESIYRNFGMAHPEGYRKALRLMKLAEKFRLPVIAFVDTPAAYPGMGAEERGQAEAIARNLREMAVLRTPIVVVIHGEGGSGGALALAIGDRILMFEHAIYSVIPPEGCAAILWKNSARAAEAAETLKLTAPHLKEFGLIDEIIPEPLGGSHRDAEEAANILKKTLAKTLDEVCAIPSHKLLDERYLKFRRMGVYEEKVKADVSSAR